MADRWHLDAYRCARAESMPCRLLILGEDNPQSASPEHALYNDPSGCAGHRLQAIFGLDDADYLGLWRTNLCNPSWNLKAARSRGAILTNGDAPWNVVVMLGRKVARALADRAALEPFEHQRVAVGVRGQEITLASLPHPSGKNQTWNSPLAVARARNLMREIAPEIAWGAP